MIRVIYESLIKLDINLNLALTSKHNSFVLGGSYSDKVGS
jgi:hypothetical protein